MRITALFLVALLGTATAAPGSEGIAERLGERVAAAVARGTVAPKNRYRWNALLRQSVGGMKGDPTCGAVLISPSVILTAASCTQTVWGLPADAYLYPLVDINAYAQRQVDSRAEFRKTVAVLTHAGWDPNGPTGGYVDDIALMLLDRPSRQTPIRLPRRLPDPAVPFGTNLTAVGLGKWERGGLPKFLQQVVLELRNQSVCEDQLPDFPLWTTGQGICAGGGDAYSGVCLGDMGGALFVPGRAAADDLLVGMSSFQSFDGCTAGKPSGFVNVPHYSQWIRYGIKILEGRARIDRTGYTLHRKPPPPRRPRRHGTVKFVLRPAKKHN